MKKHPMKYLFAIEFTPDGRKVLSGSNDCTCILWDLSSLNVIYTLEGHTNLSCNMPLLRMGKWAISGSADNTGYFGIWGQGEALKFSRVIRVCLSCLYHFDGRQAVSGSWDNTCILWDLETGEVIKTLKGHTKWITSLSITPDGRRAVSGSWDNTCILWELETGEAIKTLTGHTNWITSLSITPDGRQAVSGSGDFTCILWNLDTGEALNILKGHTGYVRAVSITRDGRRVVSGSNDYTCILWCLMNGEKEARFVSDSQICTASCFPGGVFFGEASGKTLIIKVNKKILCPLRSIVTIKQIWDFDFQKFLKPSADCPLCGHRFAPSASCYDY